MELVFVVSVIGILAAVSIPKLVISRDNARATVCESEIIYLIKEMTNFYTMYGHNVFVNHKVSYISNIIILSSHPNYSTGIDKDVTLDQGVTYYCDNYKLATIKYLNYRIEFDFFSEGSPATIQAFNALKKNLDLNDTNQRIYDFY